MPTATTTTTRRRTNNHIHQKQPLQQQFSQLLPAPPSLSDVSNHVEMLRKIEVLKNYPLDAGKIDAEKILGAQKTPFECWKSSWCWKNTFSGLQKHQAYFFCQEMIAKTPFHHNKRRVDRSKDTMLFPRKINQKNYSATTALHRKSLTSCVKSLRGGGFPQNHHTLTKASLTSLEIPFLFFWLHSPSTPSRKTKRQRREKGAHRNGRFPKSSPAPRLNQVLHRDWVGRWVVNNQRTET